MVCRASRVLIGNGVRNDIWTAPWIPWVDGGNRWNESLLDALFESRSESLLKERKKLLLDGSED